MSKLEKFVDLIINEENEEATRALHDWIVEQARNIHQELIAEDDESLNDAFLADSEDFDIDDAEEEIEAEEVFAEDDEEELDLGDAETDLEADLDLDAEIVDGDEAGLDADLELGGDDELGDEVADDVSADFADELENLEAELAELKAKFDEIEGLDSDDDEDEDEEEFDSEEDIEAVDGDAEGDDEEFADLEESWATELPKVDAPSNAEVASVNKKSTLPNVAPEKRQAGEPVEIKGKEHKGFARETAPSSQVKTGSKKPTNSLSKSDEKNKEV